MKNTDNIPCNNSSSDLKLHPVRIKTEIPVRLNIPPYIEGEFIISYLVRLANANGSNNGLYFIRDLLKANKSEIETLNWNSIIHSPALFDLLKIEGVNWIKDATIYGATRLFYSSGMQALIFNNYLFGHHVKVKDDYLYFYNPSHQLKICPKCLDEKKTFYLQTIHQVPNLNICPFHNCDLKVFNGNQGYEMDYTQYQAIEESSEELEYNNCDEDDEYIDPINSIIEEETLTRSKVFDIIIASFWKKLFLLKPDLSLDKLTTPITNVIEKKYNKNIEDFFKSMDKVEYYQFGDIFDTFPELKFYLKQADIRCISSYPGLVLLCSLRSELDIESLNIKDAENALKFETLIKDRFELIGDYEETLVHLKCKKCGKEFVTTPFSISIGFECPFCFKMPIQDYLEKIVREKSNDKEELVSPCSNFCSPLKIKNKTTTKTKEIKGLDYLYNAGRNLYSNLYGKTKPALNLYNQKYGLTIDVLNRINIDSINGIIQIKKLKIDAPYIELMETARYLCRLKKLRELSEGIYIKYGDPLPKSLSQEEIMKILEIEYVKNKYTNKKRIGFAIGTTLLAKLGLSHNPSKFMYATYIKKIYSPKISKIEWTNTYLGVDTYVVSCTHKPKPKTYHIDALFYTVIYEKHVGELTEEQKKGLAMWLIYHGVTEDKLRKHFSNNYFGTPLSVYAKAKEILGSVKWV